MRKKFRISLKDNSYQSGFTFVEVIMAAVMSATLIAGTAAMWYYFVNSFSFQVEESRALEIARDNVRNLIEEIREARDGEKGEYPLVTADDTELVFHSDIDNDGLVERVRYYLSNEQLIKQVFNYVPGQTLSYPCQGGCTICHNGANTLNIDEHAYPAHAKHGDTLGACGTGGTAGNYGQDGVYEQVMADYVRNNTRPIFTYYNGDWPGDVANNPLVVGSRLLYTRYIEIELFVKTTDGPIGPKELSIQSGVQLRNLKDNL